MAAGQKMSFNYTIPDLLIDKIDISNVYQNHNTSGKPISFGVDLEFEELQLSKTIKSSEFYALRGKIEDTFRIWESKYRKHLDKVHKETRSIHVDELNKQAHEDIDSLRNILAHTLDIDDKINWDAIKRIDSFKIKPEVLFETEDIPEFIIFNTFGRPTEYIKISLPKEPVFEQVKKDHGLITRLFSKKKIESDFELKVQKWKEEKEMVEKDNENREKVFNQTMTSFEQKKGEFEEEKKRDNEAIENLKAKYQNKDPKAIEECCDLVLNASHYPDNFPNNWKLEYKVENKIAIVEYDLPNPKQLPTIESYKYIQSRDEVIEKHLPQAAQKKLYESVIYQICIRTIHELFEADIVAAIDAVAFNGLVTNINPATGIKETKIILSVIAEKEKFNEFDLSKVDPKATFKHLKGISATSLSELTPIPPIIQLDKTDKRFIAGKNIVGYLNDSVNIAAMNWDDFEHLIRELFEKEFLTSGGEVKITQASSDGGVDAIAFDADPIRGGKIVIQAKRYTNVVGVSAVRDLYGTVLNEGATKGILVTTSNYGKDSYDFAKNKPITLLNGNNLLALLEKHGHNVIIDITEAKKIIGS